MAATVQIEGQQRLFTLSKGGGFLWPGHRVKVRSVKGNRVTIEFVAPKGLPVVMEVDASPETP